MKLWAWRSTGEVLRRGQRAILAELALIRSAQLTAARRDDQILEMTMDNQTKINDLSDQLSTAAEGLTADLAELKRQVAAGTSAQELDFSKLESKINAMTDLDAQTPSVSTQTEPFEA